jgi:hypothetical protein
MIAHILASARYARVLRLLDLERRMILSGPLAGLAAVVDRREAALAEIVATEVDLPEAFLVAVRARAERNSRLLVASLAGAKAGAAELGRLLAARDRLSTYSASGARVEMRPGRPVRDKRA